MNKLFTVITLKSGKEEKFYNLKGFRTTDNNELAVKVNNYHEIFIDLDLVKKIEIE